MRERDIINHGRPIVLWTKCFNALSSANIMRRHSLRLLAFALPLLLPYFPFFIVFIIVPLKKKHTQNNFLRMNRLEAGLAILGGSQTIKLSKSRFNFVFPLLSLPLAEPAGEGQSWEADCGRDGWNFHESF